MHDERSVFGMNKEKLIERKLLMLDYAFKDEDIAIVYGKHRNKMLSYAFSYIALHIALSKNNWFVSIKFLINSLIKNPFNVIEKRFYTILKHLISS